VGAPGLDFETWDSRKANDHERECHLEPFRSHLSPVKSHSGTLKIGINVVYSILYINNQLPHPPEGYVLALFLYKGG
jgi:hypothetical protein